VLITIGEIGKLSKSYLLSFISDSGLKGIRTGNLEMRCSEDRSDVIALYSRVVNFTVASLDYDWDLISELTVSHFYGSMVSAHDGSVDAETAQPVEHSSPPPTLAQIITSIRESRDEQTELLRLLVTNSNCDGTVVGNARDQAWSSYVEFLATHPPTFTKASEPLEADHWLHTVESKFDLLNCTENQKTLFAAQQLLGDARAWWAYFTATHPANQVQWTEFCDAFRAQHIPAGIMKSKHREFMHLQQGNQSVYFYSKMFNHLAQYAPEHVDTDEKKKYCFMKGLSTKL
jgi:hypothetical protein